MESRYQKEMSRVHPPAALVEQTRTAVREALAGEEQQGKKGENAGRLGKLHAIPRRWVPALGAMAAALLIVAGVALVSLLQNTASPLFLPMTETASPLGGQLGTIDPLRRPAQAQELDTALGTHFASWEAISEFQGFLFSNEAGTIVGGKAVFSVAGCQVIASLGEESLLPPSLEGGTTSKVGNYSVILGRGDRLVAVWEEAGDSWLIQTPPSQGMPSLTEEEFLQRVPEILALGRVPGKEEGEGAK